MKDEDIGRSAKESDASFFVRIVILAQYEKDVEKRKYMGERLEELENSGIESHDNIRLLDTILFPDGSKLKATIKKEWDDEKDQLDTILSYEVESENK